MKKYSFDNLSNWYQQVLTDAQMFTYAPVKGCINFLPDALSIWKQIQTVLNQAFMALDINEVYLPLLMPVELLAKEKSHLQGFSPEIYYVDRVHEKKLSQAMAIRPTSEILFAQLFLKQAHSYRDLPLAFNQWCSVLRHEQNTKPFLRNSEFLWQEGHTLHFDAKSALAMQKKISDLYHCLLTSYLALAPLSGPKSNLERFKGALSTLTHEVIMRDGQALQTATSHDLGQNFTKPYDIKVQDASNQWKYPFGTSWGVSTRVLGALFLAHGDELGLNIPPMIAPTQIILIARNDADLAQVNQIYLQLHKHFRVKIAKKYDFKYHVNLSQVQGIPLQLHIGAKSISAYWRFLNQKENITSANLVNSIKKRFVAIQQQLRIKQTTLLSEQVISANDINQFSKIIKANKIALVPFCNDDLIEAEIMNKYAVSIRCLNYQLKLAKATKCFYNHDKIATSYAYIGRSY